MLFQVQQQKMLAAIITHNTYYIDFIDTFISYVLFILYITIFRNVQNNIHTKIIYNILYKQ